MRWVAVNEQGLRIGEDHQNAKLSNADVEMLLRLRAEGWGYRRLSAKFEVSKRTVRDYCAGRRRCQHAWGHRPLPQPSAKKAGPDRTGARRKAQHQANEARP